MKINKVYLKGENQVSGWNNPSKLIIHHPEFYGSIERLNDIMRSMGFTMIGYNYYVRKDGSVWKGRPDNVTSGNCYNQNHSSLGICFEGNYDKDKTMPEAQFNAGVELIKELKAKYGIREVNGHKHYYNTACPGRYFPLSRMLSSIQGKPSGSISTSNSSTSVTKSLDEARRFVGTHCKELQQLLIKAGYDCGGFGADDKFGKGTYNSLIQFQKDHGLVPDALAGTRTFQKLREVTQGSSSNGKYQKQYVEHGTCTVVCPSGLKIRTAPSTKTGSVVGIYNKGESVKYNYVIDNDGYRWIRWVGASSGKYRYMAVRNLKTNERMGHCV